MLILSPDIFKMRFLKNHNDSIKINFVLFHLLQKIDKLIIKNNFYLKLLHLLLINFYLDSNIIMIYLNQYDYSIFLIH